VSKKIEIEKYSNILLPRFDTFGDIVLLQGFIKALLDIRPKAHITLLVREGYDQLAEMCPDRLIWKTTSIDPYKKSQDTSKIVSFLDKLAAERFDLILTTTYNRTWLDDLIAAKLSSTWRVKISNSIHMPDVLVKIAKESGVYIPSSLYDECVPVKEKSHETEKYQILWERLTGKKDRLAPPQLSISNKTKRKAHDFLAMMDLTEKKFLFCFPAGVSNVSLKCWGEKNFAKVITTIEKRHKLKALVAGHESERNITEKVIALAEKQGAHPKHWLGKNGDIPLACALAFKSSFYLGNDTGLMHMSAALGIPVLAIFGGGTWPRFLPCANIALIYIQELPCFYCMWDYCCLGNGACVKMVDVDNVIEGTDRLLKGEINQIEINRGDTIDAFTKNIISKANLSFAELNKEFKMAIEEILKRDKQLTKIKTDRDTAVREIRERDDKLAVLRKEMDKAVQEIHEQDLKLAELSKDRDTSMQEIRKRDEKFAKLNKDHDRATQEIRNRDKRLAELHKDRDVAAREIHKRDEQLAELSKIRDMAVQEIHERDAKLAELSKDRDMAIQEISERDLKLAQLYEDHDRTIQEIHNLDRTLAELHKDRDVAAREIHKRDEQLAELSKDLDTSMQKIHERDAKLIELSKNCNMAIQEISERDVMITKLSSLNEQASRAIPLVSIVTPVLNCVKWIEQCIESVLNQDYPQIEHIIVDGGSTDGTLEICQRYPHLIIHSKKDRGQSHAINKGFDMAQGEILAWLCADDEYEDDAVLCAVKATHSGHNVVMGLSSFINADGSLISEHPANVHPYYDHAMLLRFWKYNPISQPAIFWTRKVWESCGPIRENIYFAMDYDFWLRVSQKFHFLSVGAQLSKYRIHPEAKCFADNYGSRIELIKVSKQYWPSRWKPGFWRLYFSYFLTRNPITKHFSDGEGLLKETVKCLDSSKKWMALFIFIKAHFKHFPSPFLPNYRLVFKRILKESVGPDWFWNLGKKIWNFIRKRNR